MNDLRSVLVKMKRKAVDLPRHLKERVRRKGVVGKLCRKYGVGGKPEVNVVLVTIDCARADFVTNEVTPFLAKVGGARFLKAKTVSPWTWPSIASLITGLLPDKHGAVREEGEITVRESLVDKIRGTMGVRPIGDDVVSIPEIFEYLGGKTYFNAGSILFAEYVTAGRYVVHKDGVGMHAIDEILDAYAFMKREGEPFFIHLHIGDTHEPLYAPKKFRERFDAPFAEEYRKWKYVDGNLDEGFEEYREGKISLYKAALSYVDASIRELYQGIIEDTDIETLFVITSDHGEALWDHTDLEKKHFYNPRGTYGIGHGHSVFFELTDVPLFVFGAGIKRKIFDEEVSTAGIASAVLEIAGIEHGLDLVPSVFEGNTPICGSVAYGYEKKAWWEGKKKYVVSEGDGVRWVFDLEKDPCEQEPIPFE